MVKMSVLPSKPGARGEDIRSVTTLVFVSRFIPYSSDVGVPLINPVAVFKDNPGGRCDIVNESAKLLSVVI